MARAADPGGRRPAGRRRTDRAVVVGGSMAGLLAARVLADHFDEVLVVDRDVLPEGAEDRRGVPQGRQLHVLLPRGLDIVDRLLPGYRHDMEVAGAVTVRVPADALLLSPAGWVDRRSPGWCMVSASRPLIEATVRQRLQTVPGVTVQDRYEVDGLLAGRDGAEVRGVRVRPVDAPDAAVDVEADLVVDAAGRASRAPARLAGLGHPTPRRTQVDPNIAYASRVYRIPDGFHADWKLVMLTSQPPTVPRTGYLLPIEGDRWIVAATGAAGQHPPTDDAGFTAFLRGLRHPVIADAVADAQPLTGVRGHRGTANRRWHFERMGRWPERFVVLGDAACAFNPVYGQGMSTAAVAAEALGASLWDQRRRRPAGDLDGMSARFQRRLARATADAWMLSTGEDLRFPTTTGSTPGVALRLQHRYLDRVAAASCTDPEVADAYLRSIGMVERPTALFAPHVVAAAARARRRSAAGEPPARPGTPARVPVAAGA